MDNDQDFTGRLLIALPGIGDPRFERAVILLCAHSAEFAMGIVLNRPIEGLDLHDLMEQMDVPVQIPLHGTAVLDGGPVATDRGFALHTDDFICENATIEVDGEICMTATRDILAAMGSAAAPRQAVLALGYSGWGAGQLEREIAANAWLVGDPDTDIIFGDAYDQKWRRALTRLGIDSSRLQPDAGRA